MKARRLLSQYLEHAAISQSELARRAGISEGMLSLILAGKRRPAGSAFAIERATEGAVPASSWFPASRRAA